jgi:hypothetical protein
MDVKEGKEVWGVAVDKSREKRSSKGGIKVVMKSYVALSSL